MQRISPSKYFGNQVTLQEPIIPLQEPITPLQTNTNYTPIIVFGGICVVAIVAIAIVCSRK